MFDLYNYFMSKEFSRVWKILSLLTIFITESLFSCGSGGMNSWRRHKARRCAYLAGRLTERQRREICLSNKNLPQKEVQQALGAWTGITDSCCSMRNSLIVDAQGNISITVQNLADITVVGSVTITMPTGKSFKINGKDYVNGDIHGLTVVYDNSVTVPTIGGSLNITAAPITRSLCYENDSSSDDTVTILSEQGAKFMLSSSLNVEKNATCNGGACIVVGNNTVLTVGKSITMNDNIGPSGNGIYYAGVSLINGGKIVATCDITMNGNIGSGGAAGVGGPAGITGTAGVIESTSGSIVMNNNKGGDFVEIVVKEGHPGPNIIASGSITMNENQGGYGAGVGGGVGVFAAGGAGGNIEAGGSITMNSNQGGWGAGVGGGAAGLAAGGAGGNIEAGGSITMNSNQGDRGAGVGGGYGDNAGGAGGNIEAVGGAIENNTGGINAPGGAGVGGGGGAAAGGLGGVASENIILNTNENAGAGVNTGGKSVA